MDHTVYGQLSTMAANDATLRIGSADLVKKYPDWQFPLLKRWGGKIFDDLDVKVSSHKVTWNERQLRPVKTEVASATVAADAVEFYVKDAGVFNVDDKLRVQRTGEIMIVTAVSGGTLVRVRRAWSGTAGALALSDVVYRQGTAAPQGKDADNMVVTGMDELFNYTGIYEDVVELSGTQHNAMIHGVPNSTQLLNEKQKELMEGLQADLLLGGRMIDKAEKRHSLGGLKYLIDTYAPGNVINFGGASTWNSDDNVIAKFDDAVEKVADEMGGKPTIFMGYKAMRKFKAVQDANQRTTPETKSRGIGVADTYLSQLGTLDIVVVRERTGALNDLIFFADEKQLGYKPMKNRSFGFEPLAKVGDSYKWQVLGEYTFILATPKVHSYIYNLGL